MDFDSLYSKLQSQYPTFDREDLHEAVLSYLECENYDVFTYDELMLLYQRLS